MKKEMQQLNVCYTFILEYVNQSYVIECTLKNEIKITERLTGYIFFYQTYIHIQCGLQRVNIETPSK